MGLIGSLNTAVGGNVIDPTEYNQNLTAIRDAFNNTAVLTDYARTITVQHTFNPTTSIAPFVLGANAQGNLVTGLNADLLDGQEGAFYQNAGNLNAGTIPSARVAGAYTGITAVGVLTAGTVPASLLSGVIASARIAGAYTGITAVGTIATGVWQGTAIADAYIAALSASKLTGSIANARVTQGNVTQHQAALSIAASQLTGTIASARIAGSYTGITGVGTLTVGSIPATLLTGTVASARLAGAYTGITELGTLTTATITTLNATNLIVGGGATVTGILRFTYTGLNFGTGVASGTTVVDTLNASGVSPNDIIIVQVASTSSNLDVTTRGFVGGGITSTDNLINVYITNAHSAAVNMSDIDLEVLVIKV